MKQKIWLTGKSWIPFLLAAILASSCQKVYKDIEDYFPNVKTLSATIEVDGTVRVEGEILSEGASPITYLGFSCSTDPLHGLSARQVFGEVNEDGVFYTIYEGFDPDSVYYFRTWAANRFGYVRGEALPVQGIIAEPLTPPCTPTLNTVHLGAGPPTTVYSSIVGEPSFLDSWIVYGSTYDGPSVSFTFGAALTTKAYTIVDHTSPGPGEVFVSFQYNTISGSLSEGQKVYVVRQNPGVFEITVCNAPWMFGSSVFLFNTRFILTI